MNVSRKKLRYVHVAGHDAELVNINVDCLNQE